MSDGEDGDEWPEDYMEQECDHCYRTKRCLLTDDPYLSEICPGDYPNETWWCYRCYSERKADI